MPREHSFAREETFVSWWANSIQDYLATLSANFKLRVQPGAPTVLQCVAGTGNDQVAVGIEGHWRYNTATVERAHPGGAAGTYLVFVTAQATQVDNVPAPFTDHTDRSFALAIVAAGTPAIVPGSVDIIRQVGTLQWDGSAIVAVDALIGPGAGTGRHAASHAVGASDAVSPASIGAATEAGLAAEASARAASVAAEATARGAAVAAEAAARTAFDDAASPLLPTAAEKAALAGTSGAPGGANRYVTNSDPMVTVGAWVFLPPAVGVTSEAFYRKDGKVVRLRGSVTPDGIGVSLAFLPTGFRPIDTGDWFCGRIDGGSGGSTGRTVVVSSDGWIHLFQVGSGAIMLNPISFIAEN